MDALDFFIDSYKKTQDEGHSQHFLKRIGFWTS